MMTPDGPCLVEMNCRSHGGEGSWVPLARSLTGGYSQVDAAIDSFLDESAFARLPERPRPFQASGQEVMLVSMRAGRVLATPGFDKIRQLKSFESLTTDVTVGSTVELSIDLFTSLGCVFLMHEDPDVMAADLRAIRAMESECTLFELSEDRLDSESDTSSHSGSSSPGRVEDSCTAGVLPALNLLVKWVNNQIGADALPPTSESRA